MADKIEDKDSEYPGYAVGWFIKKNKNLIPSNKIMSMSER